MSAADQENRSKGGSGSADASFERLLAQLETGAAPAATSSRDGSVSQIFSVLPVQAPPPDAGVTAVLPAHGGSPLGKSSAVAPPAAIEAGEHTQISLESTAFDASTTGVSTESAPPASATPAAQQASPNAASEPPQVPQGKAPSAQEGPGEFTRIFTQLPTPRSAPPAILSDRSAQPVAASPAPPGEFTQFFQARDQAGSKPAAAGGSTAEEAQKPPLPEPIAPREPVALRAPDPLPTPRAAAQAFAPPSLPAFAPSQAAEPMLPRLAPETPREAAAEPGAFTALFQTPFTGHSAPNAVPFPAQLDPTSPVSSAAPVLPSRSHFAEPGPVKPNAAASGGFTELLRSLSDDRPAAIQPPQASSSPQAATGSRSDAFSPVAAPAPQSSFAPQAPASQSFAARVPDPAGPFAPHRETPGPPAGASGPGEFTQLMQSLASPGASKPAAGPAAQAPFFSGGAELASAGPSEFTRVIQGSAARSAQASVATFTPAPPGGGGAAVGLPIAAPQMPKPPAPPAAEAKTTLQKLMPWLLLANGLLLILLIVLAVVFLKRH